MLEQTGLAASVPFMVEGDSFGAEKPRLWSDRRLIVLF
jgi:hypothetical protein